MTDLTKITEPLCFLPEETWEALKTHHCNGGAVQLLLATKGTWMDVARPSWLPGSVYRAKPEPLELWVNVFPYGVVAYETEEKANSCAGPARLRCVRMIEAPGQEEGA